MKSSVDHVSGEIFFSLMKSDFQLEFENEINPLNTFLKSDVNSEDQKVHNNKTLVNLKNIRYMNSLIYDSGNNLDSDTLEQLIISATQNALFEANSLSSKTVEDMVQFQKISDVQTMQLLLLYCSTLKDEMNLNIELLDRDTKANNLRKLQAKKLRDIQIFSRHLKVETQGKVYLNMIASESTQWKRCGKAVKENVSISRLQSMECSDIKILNVFKIEHKLLAKGMQSFTDNHSDNIKVKGLFCSLSETDIYGFSAFGLSSQHCENGDGERDPIFPTLFQLPWFCTELSGSTEPIRVGMYIFI
jgi:virulence-associated protein VapD